MGQLRPQPGEKLKDLPSKYSYPTLPLPGSPRRKPQHGSRGWATGPTPWLHLAPPTILSPALGPRVLGGLLGGMWSCFRLPMGSSSQTGLDSPHQQLGEISPVAQELPSHQSKQDAPHTHTARLPHPTHTPREPGRAGLASWAVSETARLPPPHPSRPSTTLGKSPFPARPLNLCFNAGVL